MNNTEIERKWLIDAFPDMEAEGEEIVEQAYLGFSPAVRVRKRQRQGEEARYVLTIKGGGTLRRTEVEKPLSADEYEALLPLAGGAVATKRFRTYRLPGGECLECSLVDEGAPSSFLYAEVEFASEEAARAFQPPACLGREVTEEPGQTMAAYCRQKAGLCAEEAGQ